MNHLDIAFGRRAIYLVKNIEPRSIRVNKLQPGQMLHTCA